MKKKLYRNMMLVAFISVIVFAVFDTISDIFFPEKFYMKFIFIFVSLIISFEITLFITNMLSKGIIKSFRNFAGQIEKFNSGEDSEIETEYSEFQSIADTVSGLNRKVDKYKGRWRNESEKIALIFENMIEGMVILDENGYIININKSAVNIFTDKEYVSGMTHISKLTD